MKNIQRWIVFLVAILVMVPMVHAEEERIDGYYTMVTSEGRVICRTSHKIHVGDEYLSSDNRLYRVDRIEGDQAMVRFVRQESASVIQSESVWGSLFKGFLAGEKRVQANNRRPIAIYHTHTDESYVPTDGRSSIKANGGIYQVGEAMASKFRQLGVPTIHDRTPHDPHDAMAYDRSRRTAANLLKRRPLALIDVHRDAVPREEYADQINNTEVTKVQLVVGRQNPNRAASDAFAKQIKATVDKKYPGFVKGIFYGRGKYNQDLAPRLILLEVGAHTNSRQAAERGAAIFAAAAQEVLYNRGRGAAGGRMERGATRSLLWILGIAAAGVIAFLLINKGGAGLKRFGGNIKDEFTGALAPEETKSEENNDNPENNDKGE